MNVLFVGDMVGSESCTWLAGRLPDIKREYDIDLTIVNAENIRIESGETGVTSGMEASAVQKLLDAGVDVITSGNHAWDGPDAETLLAHPQVIRPLNMPEGWAGKGSITLDVAGETVTVVNLADKDAIPVTTPLYGGWSPAAEHGTVIVDMHGTPPAKYGFAHTNDGKVAA
ncbi:MAG TPA: YmdB family metallophosphoesterase, partial [Thermomicrobiales bacterium]|nr:YmdB family metallophosphoesterase [Thermomicrobiales bacterium]